MGRIGVALALLSLPTLAFAQTAPPAPPAPNAMSRQELREEVTRLRALVRGRAVQPSRPPGCTAPESRQFDFWLGEWDVSPPNSAATVSESSITLHDQGCVIIEHWRPFGGGHGHSINTYDPSDQRWHQSWADASGTGRTDYVGALESDGLMRFDQIGATPPAGMPAGRRRMSFQRVDENTVRQWGERFDEAAQAWAAEWDFTYRRRAGTTRQN